MSRAAIQAGIDLGDPPRLSDNNLHPFRLKVKHLRNILKLADDPDNEFVDALGDVKDAIGEWRDWLVGVAEKVLDHGPQCKLRGQLKKISEQRYATAVEDAQRLQRRYIGVPGHKNSHGKEPHQPDLSAAARVAA